MMDRVNPVISNRGRSFGVTLAEVITTEDPENLGRIKVLFQLTGTEIESDWIQIMSFYAGQDHGAIFLPKAKTGEQPGDNALIAFADGDPNKPYVLGFLYNGVLTPPVETAAQQQNIRQIKTSGGKVLTFDDSEEGGITITDHNENSIEIDSANNKITITSKGDMNITATGTLTIQAAEVVMQNSSGSVKVNLTEGSLSLNGGESMTLKAAMIDIN